MAAKGSRTSFSAFSVLAALLLWLAVLPGVGLAQSTTSYTYDALGRVITAVNSDGTQVDYAYDPAGNRTQVSGNGGSLSVGAVSITVVENTTGTAGLSPFGYYTSLQIAAQPSHGVATLNGSIVTYTPASGYTGADSFTYTATGPSGTSTPAAVSITVAGAAAPTVGPVSATVTENSANNPITLSISGSGVTSVAATQPLHGTATASGTSITYTPIGGYLGSDSFTYTATNAAGTSSPATVSITVTVAGIPTVGAVSATVAENSVNNPITLNISGSGVTSVAATAPANGTATASGTSITYTPNSNYSGPDSFAYTATNAAGTSTPAPVSITVTGTAGPPIAGPSSATVPVGSSGTLLPLNLSGGAATSVTITSGPNFGATYVSGATIDYVPDTPYSGADSVTYTASNAYGTSAPATVSINVAYTAAPIAGPVSMTVAYGSSANRVTFNLTGGAASSIGIITPVAHGFLTDKNNDEIYYTPGTGYAGSDSFTYNASNSVGTSATAMVSITIPVPAPPIAGSTSAKVTQDTTNNTIKLNLSGGAADTIAIVAQPSAGVVTVSGNTVTYTPNSAFLGTDSFAYTGTNISGTSAPGTVTIRVVPPLPVAGAVSAAVAYDSSNNTIPLNLSGGPAASVQIISSPQHGTATVSGLTIVYTPTSGFTGTDTLTYTATNAGGSSAAATITITVPAAPTAYDTNAAVAYGSTTTLPLSLGGGAPTSATIATPPTNGIATTSGGTIIYTPNAGYSGPDTLVFSVANVSGTSSQATANITVNPQPPTANPISAIVAYNSSNNLIPWSVSGGAITSSGCSAAAHGQVFLSNGVFHYTPTAGYSGSDSFVYVVSNSGGTSTAQVSITVLQLPVASSTSATVSYNSTNNTIAPILSGGAASSVTVVTAPANGTASVSGMAFTYTPNAGYFGQDSFTYAASNAVGASAAATVTVTVNPPPPIAGATSATVPYNSYGAPIALNLSGGPATSVTVPTHGSGVPQHGAVTVSGATVSYKPTIGYSGSDSFTYTASNVAGTSASATVTIGIVPVAGASSASIPFNSTGAPITPTTYGTITGVAVVTGPTNGTVTASGTTFTYVPATGYVGPDSFTYTASNTYGISNTAAVTITVLEAAPIASASSANVPYNTPTPIPLSLSGGSATSVAQVTTHPATPANGTVSVSGVTVSYTPTSGYSGADSFTYTASNSGGTSASAIVSITVLPQVPKAYATSATVAYDSTNNGLTPNLTGGTATSVAVATQASNGTVTASGTAFSYTPNSSYFGADSFTYTASNAGGTSAPATFSITVNPQPPIAAASSANVPYNSTGTVIPLSLSGGTATSVTTGGAAGPPPNHGTVTASGTTVTYIPNSGYTGTDAFYYYASNAGGSSAAVKVTVTVLPQLPVAHASGAVVAYDSTNNGLSPSLTGGTATSVAVATQASHGTATASGTALSYTPTSGYFGSDSFTYTASNAGGTSAPATFSITVNPQPPIATASSTNVPYNTATPIPLSLSGGTATSVTTGAAAGPSPNHGTVTASGTTVTYTPTSGYTGTDAFYYYASNAGGNSATVRVSITVLPQAPVASNSNATVTENAGFTPISLSLSGGTATSVAVATGPTHGITSASGTSISYEPNSDYLGSDSFTYTASNTGGTSAPATVSITVKLPVPIAGPVSATVARNTSNNPITLNLSGGAATSVAVASQALNGTATAAGTSITYTPTANFYGSDHFTYNATNASGTSSSATVTVQVTR